jgi:peptidyl-prolyl cis-trans isomerase SurA
MIEAAGREAIGDWTRGAGPRATGIESRRPVQGTGRRGTVGVALALLAAACLGLAPGVALAETELVEGIVVRVNERILTTREFAHRVQERSAETGKPIEVSEYPQVIDDAVNDFCMLERAAELKIEVEDDEVEAAVKGLREQNQVTDDAAFERSLKTMGMTVDGLKARLRETITINRLLSKEIGPIPVTEAELQDLYERDKEAYRVPEGVRLQHVIFSIGLEDEGGQRAMAAASRLVAASRAGQDFSTLVQEQVAAGAATGGDLGVVRLPDLRKELADALAKMKPGEISDPLKTSSGVHVFKLLERVPTSYKPFSEVVNELRERELSERYRSHMNGVVESVKKRYVVETHPELVIRQK